MADSKISALPASTTPLAGTEVLPIVQGATTKQVSVANLTAGRAVNALSLTSTTTLGVTGTSTLNGNAIISVTDNTNAALRITQLGTGNALLVEDSANPDSTSFLVGPSGEVGIRLYASAIPGNIALMVNGDDGNSRVVFQRSDATTNGAQLFMRKARGSLAAPTIVASGDMVARFSFSGFDGTNYLETANISSDVDGTPGTNDMPGRLVFSTTADGAASPTERMRIDSAGTVSIPGNLSLAAYTETIVASGTVGASATLAITAGTVLTATLTSATACTITLPPVSPAGKSFILLLKQPASGTATTATFITSPASHIMWNSSGAPTITATVGKMDILTFVSDGTNWYGSYSQGYTP